MTSVTYVGTEVSDPFSFNRDHLIGKMVNFNSEDDT